MSENIEEKDENESYIQVAIRIKPLDENKKTCLQYIPDSNQIVINKDFGSDNSKRLFSFDYIYGPSTTQQTIYEDLCPSLINHFLDGINITVFAYGQTGTGKTYTMGSEISSMNSEESIGIIPRVIQGLYNGIDKKKLENDDIEYVVKITFIEIYQEQLRDLLHPDTLSKDINIWENNNAITISGVQEEVVHNLDEILTFIEQGVVSRMTGTTNVHLHSSRSHAIFTIILEQYLKPSNKDINVKDYESNNYNNNKSPTLIRMSKFHLVDLAGSERVKKTGAEGIRFKESVKINSGLLALGNVISSLSMDANNNNEKHIPYRDSKLTRLLQDSLGGNSKTIMIACISSAYENYDESLNTLKYAQRARKIKNKPIINNINLQALKILTMKQKIEELENKLDQSTVENNNNKSISNFNINEEYDDEEWLEFFINGFKDRTAKGLNAIKELNDLKEENEKLLNELNQIKEENELRNQNKEKIKEDNTNLSKEIEILNYHNNEMTNDLNSISYYSNLIANNILLSSEQRDHFNAIVSKWINYENNNNNNHHLLKINSINGYDYNEHMMVPPNTAQSNVNENKNNAQDLQVIENQKKMIQKLEEESEQSNQMLDHYRQDINNLQEKLTQTTKSIEMNDKKIKELERIKSELEIENESLKDNNNKLQERIYFVESVETKSSEKQEGTTEKTNENPSMEENENKESEENPQKEGILLELDMAIKAKVELTRELAKINKEFEKSKHYMSNEIQKLERDLDSVRGELVKAQNQNQEKDNQKDKMKEEYEKKLKIFENQLTKSRSRQKGYDKIKKENALFERKNQTLQSEIEKMTNQLSIFKKKTKDDSDKLLEVETRKAKEIALLKKQIEEDSKQIRQQGVKIEMLRKKLDRKIEENNTIAKKLKDNMIIFDNVTGNVKKISKQAKNSSNGSSTNNSDNNNNNNKNNKNSNSNDDNNNNNNNNDKNINNNESNESEESKNKEKNGTITLKKSKIEKVNMNKIKLSNTLNYTLKEIKRRISVLNETLNEKKKEMSKLTEDKVEENKVCTFMIESLNNEKELLLKQLEQIQKKNNVTFKTTEVQTEMYQENEINNAYHEVFDEKQKEEYEDYIETLENERFQLNERLNNIISDHNREINELKELYEKRLYNSKHELDSENDEEKNDEAGEKSNDNASGLNNHHDYQEYIDKISSLEQDNKYFKEKQKDLKKKLREFVNENNHLISIVNKEKIKNSKLKNYIQNVLNVKRKVDDTPLNNNSESSSTEMSNNGINGEFTDQTAPYHKIRNQEKFTLKRNMYTTDATLSGTTSEDQISTTTTSNNSNNDINMTESDQERAALKASRKSLKSNYSSESTLVPSESEPSMSTSTSMSDLTKINYEKDSNHRTINNNELSLPVIYLKATDNNSIVKAKNIISKPERDSTNEKNSNNNPREGQDNSIINNSDFLPSISTTTTTHE